jgi:hypothetical protein
LISVAVKYPCRNIRRIAETKLSLSAGEYFALLSKFILLAPDVSYSLVKFVKFADFEADSKQNWRNIEVMIALLADLGCEKYISDLYSISHAREKGDWRLTAFHAKKILDDFNALYAQAVEAKIVEHPKSDASPDGPGGTDSPSADCVAQDVAMPLKQYIRHLHGDGVKDEQEDILAAETDESDQRQVIFAVDDASEILTAVAAVLSSDYKVFKLSKP